MNKPGEHSPCEHDELDDADEMVALSVGRLVLYLATIAGIALLIRSILIGPIPLTVSAGALVSYFAIVLCGVFVPRLEMFARQTWRGPVNRAHVALTFDDGPDPISTPRVLDILKKHRAHATFFLIGYKAELAPALVQRILDEGHEIGIHSYTHDRFLSLRSVAVIQADLLKARDTLERISGRSVSLFRPPVGHVSPRTAAAVKALGLRIVAWSIRGCDGIASARADDVASRVIRRIGPGSIILLHDASEKGDREPAGVAALERVLSSIDALGLAPVHVSSFVRRPAA